MVSGVRIRIALTSGEEVEALWKWMKREDPRGGQTFVKGIIISCSFHYPLSYSSFFCPLTNDYKVSNDSEKKKIHFTKRKTMDTF